MDYPLMTACLTGDLATVQRLVSSVHAEKVDLNTKRGVLHFSPIHYACSGGHCEVAQYLIDKAGCDPRSKSQQGKTPLHLACETGHLNVVRLLLQTYKCEPDSRDQKGQTPLHLASRASIAQYLVETCGRAPETCTDNIGRNPLHSAVAMNHLETAGYLLSERHCNPNAADSAGDVPLSLTDKPNMIGKLLSHGADPGFLHKTFKKHLPKPPTPASTLPVKLIVVGGTLAGNTSLTRALKKETLAKVEPIVSSTGVKVVQRWDPPTAGIAHYSFANKQFGRVALYDFAGHTHYHTVQAALLNNAVGNLPPVFIVVTNLSNGKEAVESDVYYWLGFLANAIGQPKSKAQVVIVGSHSDQVKLQGTDASDWLDLETVRRTHPSRGVLDLLAFIPMDCRKASSPGLDLLCQTLKGACDRVRELFNPQHYYYTHCFWLWLSNTFEDTTAVSLSTLKGQLRTDKTLAREKMELFELMKGHHSSEEKRSTYLVSILPDSEAELCDLCIELNDQAHVLFFHDLANVQNSWIVFHQGNFLEDVIGAIFAPPGYREHRYLATPTGMITMEQFAQEFEAYPTQMLAEVLKGMECGLGTVQSGDPFMSNESAKDSPSPMPKDGKEVSLFFPCLVTIESPETLWSMYANQLTRYAGWVLLCSDIRQPFTLRYLHALVLRVVLTFYFALDTSRRSSAASKLSALKKMCSIWNSGVFFVDARGVKCLVELSSNHTQLVIRVASHADSTIHMAEVFSSLLQLALKAKEDYSPLTPTGEFFLHPTDAQCYPLASDPGLFPIKDVAKAIIGIDGTSFIHNSAPVDIHDIIPFEPYLGLGYATISHIFDHPSSCLSVSSDVSSKVVSGCLPIDGACLSSYENLRAKLNQFSVFAGRNPLVLSGIQEVWPSTPPSSSVIQSQPFAFEQTPR